MDTIVSIIVLIVLLVLLWFLYSICETKNKFEILYNLGYIDEDGKLIKCLDCDSTNLEYKEDKIICKDCGGEF